jgi:DNA/RNA-binding domain of Phe-tRNA-synthetase-like protein
MTSLSYIDYDMTERPDKPLRVDITPEWIEAFPGAHIGLLLVEGADNTQRATRLDGHKLELENELRSRYAGMQRVDLLQIPELQAYRQYYKRFDKTYHVQLQLESVLAGKPLPSVSPLVDACFAAELEDLLLTASHDADKLQPPLTIDVSTMTDEIISLNGTKRTLKPGDMVMRDAGGLVCSVIYGQELDSAVLPETRNVLYVTYAPASIAPMDIAEHQKKIAGNIHLFSPEAHLVYWIVYSAD